MSTAHRPTFNPARGSSTAGQVPIPTALKRVRDLPSETSLKVRETDTISSAPSDRDLLKKKLEISDSRSTVPITPPLAIASSYFPEDADEVLVEDDSADEESDEEVELLRELEMIKKEKAEEEAKLNSKLQAKREEEIAQSNPLLGGNAMKRQWTDDTVFRNKGQQPSKKSTFVNDSVKSEFHKKFLSKYIA